MNVLPLLEDKKLCVTFRVEPGCLGPQGATLISKFCDLAQVAFKALASDYIAWNIVPRSDKTLPETQYALMNKRISASQAGQYLALFDMKLDELESDFDDKLEALIVDYMKSDKATHTG
tara:strand:+ start:523 stop:879 length:357 start_codon:yes stop_codon:yes gene_type:complete